MNKDKNQMILKETLAQTVKAQKELILGAEKGIQREILQEIKFTPDFTLVISGIRRAGKSTLLRQMIANNKEFYYLNFEDVRIFGFDVKDFGRLDDIFFSEGDYDLYFFDELQNVNDWERYMDTARQEKESCSNRFKCIFTQQRTRVKTYRKALQV